VLELRSGGYEQVAAGSGEGSVEVSLPFRLRMALSDLLR